MSPIVDFPRVRRSTPLRVVGLCEALRGWILSCGHVHRDMGRKSSTMLCCGGIGQDRHRREARKAGLAGQDRTADS